MKKKQDNKEVVILHRGNEVNREPMSFALTHFPYETTLELNILYCTLNKIAMNDFKDRDLFDVNAKVVIKATEIGETNFSRINTALKRMLDARLSIVDKQNEYCWHFAPIIGTQYAKGTGKIEISINSDLLVEYRSMVERGYSSYQLAQILSLKKFFSKRLYEILSGLYMVNGGIWDVEFDYLKQLLSTEKYPSRAFVQHALKETAQEFEDKDVDVRFSYELVKGGKNRIERVIFTIKPKDELNKGRTMSYAENKELTAVFETLSSDKKNLIILSLVNKYSFKHTQIDEILNSPAKMARFYSTHNKIEAGLIKNVEHRTGYMAQTLGFGKGAKKKLNVQPVTLP